MTPINYPASLPCLRWEPYSVSPRPGSIEETLGMITYAGRVYTANNEVVAAEVVLDASDEPTFRTFYKTTLSMGTQWFNGPILRNDVYENYELLFIGAPPVFTPIAHNVVRASFALLTRGEPLIPGPEPEYELTASQAVNIDANDFAEAPTMPAAPAGTTVTIMTLVTDKLIIRKPSIASDPALDDDAWSPWPNNGTTPPGDGLTWLNRFIVSNQADVVVLDYDSGRFVSPSTALAGTQADMPIELTGATSYTFWGWDIICSDNRRALSLRVETYSLIV